MSETKPLDLSAAWRSALVAGVCFAAAIGVGLVIEVEQGPIAIAEGVRRTEPVAVRHADAGQLGRWNVAVGAAVAAGDMIATLDTRSLDAVIDALKKQIGAVRARADAIRQEAQALTGVEGTSGARLAQLEAHVADLDKEEVGLKVRLSMNEQDRQRTIIKATVAGRVAELPVAEGASFKAGTTLAVIIPEAGRLRLEATWPVGAIASDTQRAVRAWPHDAVLPTAVYAGRIETIDDADSTGRVRARIAVDVTGTALAEPQPREHRMRFVVQRLTERRALLLHVVAPVWRPSQIVNASSP